MRPFLALLIALAATLALPAASAAGYHTERASFQADAAAGLLPLADFGFDAIAPGTDIGGASFGDIGFVQPGSALIVIEGIPRVAASDPGLPATSPSNVLSPGGSDGILVCGQGQGIDNDDVKITFDGGTHAAGIDVIFKSPDGASFTSVTFRDVNDVVLLTTGIPAPSGEPGYQFVGLVSNAQIGSVQFDEFDGTCAGSGAAGDEQVGYDSLVYAPNDPPAPPVPELGSALLLGAGLVAVGAAALVTRRR